MSMCAVHMTLCGIIRIMSDTDNAAQSPAHEPAHGDEHINGRDDVHDGWIVDTTEAEDAHDADMAAYERRRADAADTADGDDGADDANSPENNAIARYGGGSARVTLRLPKDVKRKLAYWSDASGVSMSEYVLRALENQFDRDNGRFDGETLVVSRLNTVIDALQALTYQTGNLDGTVQAMFRMLSTLATGETELLDIDDEDGDL